jgi:hypothetical protein
VRGDYARLYGSGWEDRFTCDPMPVGTARALHREWLSQVEARITNIRAERKGEGRTLTPMEARGLAGEWYLWFTAKHAPHTTARDDSGVVLFTCSPVDS